MWLVFLFLLMILLGFVLAKIEITLRDLEITSKKFDFKIIIKFKLWKVFPILLIKLNQNGIVFLKKTIPYPKIISKERLSVYLKKMRANILDKKIKHIDIKEKIMMLKNISLTVDKMIFYIKVGGQDIFLTNALVIVISSVLSNILRKQKLKYKNINYQVLPEFNHIKLEFVGRAIFSIKTIDVLKIFLRRNRIRLKNKTDDLYKEYLLKN